MLPTLRDSASRSRSERSWRISYSSNKHNPVAEFYIPALECAVQYDRQSGFFNSANPQLGRS